MLHLLHGSPHSVTNVSDMFRAGLFITKCLFSVGSSEMRSLRVRETVQNIASRLELTRCFFSPRGREISRRCSAGINLLLFAS